MSDILEFEPKTEAQIIEGGLMPDGVYDFEIMGTGIHTKQGDDGSIKTSIKLSINVYDLDGKTRGQTVYLTPSYMKLLAHACDACKVTDKYETGKLRHDDFSNKTGKLRIGRQIDKRDNTLRNVVSDFLKRDDAAYGTHSPLTGYTKPVTPEAPPFDDEIPFN